MVGKNPLLTSCLMEFLSQLHGGWKSFPNFMMDENPLPASW